MSGERTPVATGTGERPSLWRILTHFDLSKLAPSLALRNSLGVILPIIAGFALGMPRGGLAMASGALNVSYSDGHDPYAERAKRMLASTMWCAVAVLLGSLTGHRNLEAVIVAAIWAFAAGMLVSLGTTPADVGVISTVTLVVFAAQALTPRQAVESALLAVAGGLLQILFSIALWPVRRYEPERRALGELFLALAEAAGRALNARSAPPATAEAARAQETLAALGNSESIEAVRYRALLGQAERIRLSVTTLARLRARLQRGHPSHPAIEAVDRFLDNSAQMLRDIGEALGNSKAVPPESDRLVFSVALAYQLREDNIGEPASFAGAVAQNARFQMDALSGQIRAVIDLASRATPEGQAEFAREEARQPLWLRFSGRLATLRANLNLHSAAFRHALRLATCIAMGDAIGRTVETQRSYWIPMTIVLVLKPEFATTFSRGILRIAGTIAGLLLATAMFHFLPIHTATSIALIGLFTFLMRWVGPANYGIFAVTISALIVLLLTINGVSPKEVIAARGANTVAGGALALLAYTAWPTWERTRVPELFANMLEAYRASFHSITESYLRPQSANQKQREKTRQNGRTARSNLEASLERLGVEPGTKPIELSHLNGMLANSHRFAHAMMALEAGLPHAQEAPVRPAFRTFTKDIDKTLELLATMLRGKKVAEKEFPNLREGHNRLVQSGDPVESRYALANMEADRMTNSLNTLREQISSWVREKQS